MVLALSEPGKSNYMGVLHLGLTLQPKTQEEKEQVGRTCIKSGTIEEAATLESTSSEVRYRSK